MLESVERQTGKRPAGLDGPPLPHEMARVWRLFGDLAMFRRAGFGGPERIGPLDIAGYAMIFQDWPEPWEARAITRLDSAYLESWVRNRPSPKSGAGGKSTKKTTKRER